MLRLAVLANDLSSLRRRVLRRPAEIMIPSATLAIVIGVGTAVFAVVNGALIRPLPLPDDARLVRVFTMPPSATDVRSRNPLASVDFVRFRERSRTLDRLEVIWQRERGLTGAGDSMIVKTGSVSAGFFDLLGGRTALGRTFSAAEDQPGSSVAVLGYGLWQRAFGGDPSIVGRTISLDGEPHVVIGVMAADFQPAYRESELWTPLGVNAGNMPMPNATYLVSIGRLAPGRSVSDARQEFTQLMGDIAREAANRRGWTAGVVTLREYQFGERRWSLLIVFGMSCLLLILAATNIASVTLAQVIGRQEEFALRTHLGADSGDLFRLIGFEALLVFGVAAIGGLGLAALGLPLILSLDPDTARALGPTVLDWRVYGAAFVSAFVLANVSGVWPAAAALPRRGPVALRAGVRATRSRTVKRVEAALFGLQAAMAFTALVVGSGLLQAFWRVSTVETGFDPRDVLTAQVRLSNGSATHEDRIALMDRLLDAVQRIPTVVTASSVSSPFIPGFTYATRFDAENRPTADGQLRPANFRRVAPGYFRTMRIPLRQGRDFSLSDRRSTPWVAIVSESLAKQVWPGESPIGYRVRRTEPGTGWMTIVGVAADVKDVSLSEGPDPTLYLCQEQHLPTGLPIALVVRTSGRPLLTANLIRGAVASVDRTQVVDRFLPMTNYLDASLSTERFRTTLIAVFILTGLLLVSVGLAGTTARSVADRRQELGVRLALGSTPSELWTMTVSSALRPVVCGIAVGTFGAIVGVRLVGAVLAGVSPPSAQLWAAAVGVIVVLCAAAAALPARRVFDVQPAAALRAE